MRAGKPFGRALSYNGSFMASVLQALAIADLIDDKAKPLREAPWPPAKLKLAPERADDLLMHAQTGETIRPPPSVAEQRAVDAYRAADARFRAGKPGRGGRVPTYKFSSNDGWWVTREEAKKLADGVTAMLASDDDFVLACDVLDFDRAESARFEREVRGFRDFCRRAAAADGFEVH